jgi:hypothetical protein
MKNWLTPILLVSVGWCILAGQIGAVAAEPEFPYLIAYELGDTEFAPGDAIDIQQMRGTLPAISTGGVYCVEGTYTLASKDEATLALFSTSKNQSGPTPVDAAQKTKVSKGSGTFRLIKRMDDDGYLHVSFYSGNSFGGVYFGQGDGVLRHKSWSVLQPNQTATTTDWSAQSANQALRHYLGEAVPPPPRMDPKYSVEGLSNAVVAAAQAAGVPAQVKIEGSEFPFLVGVICSRPSFARLIEELKKDKAYADQGSVGSETCQAMNIVPYPALPSEASERISRRLTVRMQMFHERLSATRF